MAVTGTDRSPGWYAASKRTERFWDGEAWTGRRRRGTLPGTVAGTTAKPSGRWVLVSAAGAMVVVMAVSASTLLRSSTRTPFSIDDTLMA